MNDRIKAVRLKLGLSQEAFCERLGVTRGVITNIELHKVVPSSATIKAIIREFDVNESWLRDGIGDMFRKQNRDEELADFFNDVLQDKPDDFRRRFIQILSRLDVKEWELLEQMALRLADETEKADPED